MRVPPVANGLQKTTAPTLAVMCSCAFPYASSPTPPTLEPRSQSLTIHHDHLCLQRFSFFVVFRQGTRAPKYSVPAGVSQQTAALFTAMDAHPSFVPEVRNCGTIVRSLAEAKGKWTRMITHRQRPGNARSFAASPKSFLQETKGESPFLCSLCPLHAQLHAWAGSGQMCICGL